MPEPELLLSYDVSPPRIPYSAPGRKGGDARRALTLSITVRNATGAAVPCGKISFDFPPQARAMTATSLQPSRWPIRPGATITSFVSPPVVDDMVLRPGDQLGFEFQGFAAPLDLGVAELVRIIEDTDGKTRSGSPTVNVIEAPLSITGFLVDAVFVDPAQVVTFGWSTLGADEVTLNLPLEPPRVVDPNGTHRYTTPERFAPLTSFCATLDATARSGGALRSQAQLHITIRDPRIVRFVVTHGEGELGYEPKLEWETDGAKFCKLYPPGGKDPEVVKPSGAYKIPMHGDGTYLLEPHGWYKPDAEPVMGTPKNVGVELGIVERKLTVDPRVVERGEPVVLLWRTRHTRTRSIAPTRQFSDERGTITWTPEEPWRVSASHSRIENVNVESTYTLEVQGRDAIPDGPHDVAVFPTLKLIALVFKSSGGVVLSWSADGAAWMDSNKGPLRDMREYEKFPAWPASQPQQMQESLGTPRAIARKRVVTLGSGLGARCSFEVDVMLGQEDRSDRFLHLGSDTGLNHHAAACQIASNGWYVERLTGVTPTMELPRADDEWRRMNKTHRFTTVARGMAAPAGPMWHCVARTPAGSEARITILRNEPPA
jgi:hypothetical protein